MIQLYPPLQNRFMGPLSARKKPFWDASTAYGVEISGNTYTNVDGTGWGRGACYAYPLTGDFRFEYVLTDTTIARWVGISDTPTLNYSNAERYIYTVNGAAAAYDNGALIANRDGRYVAGDTISIERVGSTLIFAVNDVAFYVNSTVSGALYLCSAVYTQGQSLTVTRVGADIEVFTDLAPDDLTTWTADAAATLTDIGDGSYRLSRANGSAVYGIQKSYAGTSPWIALAQFEAKVSTYDSSVSTLYGLILTYSYYSGVDFLAGALGTGAGVIYRNVQDLGDGWYRHSFVTSVAAGANFRIQANSGNSVYDIRNPTVFPITVDPGELGAFFDAWTAGNATFTPGETDPDGNSNAWEMAPAAGGYVQYNFPGGEVFGRQIKVTVDAKIDTYDGAYPFLHVLGSRTWYQSFNLVSGELGGGGGLADSSIANLGSGWYRLSVTTNDPIGCGAFIRLQEDSGTSVYHLYNCKVTAI
jgi:hypothetical protein